MLGTYLLDGKKSSGGAAKFECSMEVAPHEEELELRCRLEQRVPVETEV